jgi:sterol desaturase/sphingolipid hydroxylase (fatty acid hydroxylase superfamily)
VPSLIVNRRVGSPTRTIVVRCLAIAVTAAVFAGGLGFWWFTRQPDAELPFAQLLAIKATFGGLLALIATPIALRLLLSSTRQAKP